MSGWDGDALAGQLEDAEERALQAAEARRLRGTEKVGNKVREQRLETLRLSKARICEQLTRATNPAHRTMLERALLSIEEEIKEQ
jgi:hypothetical protein